ncbi:MAG: hypothetical protein LBM73_02280 [Candidatus Nomurabacteria bacterium]|nr:hypothetical protein [Candidatus Nomurabacteria bacterium]
MAQQVDENHYPLDFDETRSLYTPEVCAGTNCYAYALGLSVPAFAAYNPGGIRYIRDVDGIGRLDSDSIVDGVVSDCEELGLCRVEEADSDGLTMLYYYHKCDKRQAEYSSDDFHFLRLDRDGSYSNKIGKGQRIFRLDTPSNTLTNISYEGVHLRYDFIQCLSFKKKSDIRKRGSTVIDLASSTSAT